MLIYKSNTNEYLIKRNLNWRWQDLLEMFEIYSCANIANIVTYIGIQNLSKNNLKICLLGLNNY